MLSNWIAGDGRRYFDAVWQAVTKAQAQAEFRGSPDYRTILEHVPEWEGRACLDMLEDGDVKALLDAAERADRVGGAQVFDFDGRMLSPTTLRYAKVLQDLTRFFPAFQQYGSVAEIGIGYGGQARFVSDFMTSIGGALKVYDLIDLLPVTLLSQNYLDNFRLRFACRYMTKSQIPRDGTWDLVISNYAFSEFDRDLQTEYLENVLLRSRSGYLTMNTGLYGFDPWNSDSYVVEELLAALPNAAILAERPKTGPSNYILVFGEHACVGLRPDELHGA